MVWVLLGVGLLLVIFNIKAINKEKNSFNLVLNNTEEDMKEFDFKLSELRREFSETILELQKEIEEIKETYIYESDTIESSVIDKNIIEKNITENNIIENNIKETKGKEKINEEYNKDNLGNKEEISTSNIDKTKIEQAYKNDNNVKIEEINSLLTEGYSIEDISEKLGIGKGEVLLIKELYIK